MSKKLLFFCTSSAGKWGKGDTIITATENADIFLGKRANAQYIVWGAIFHKFETPEDQKNMLECITADMITGNPMFYETNRTPEDTAMIKKYFIEWVIVMDGRKN